MQKWAVVFAGCVLTSTLASFAEEVSPLVQGKQWAFDSKKGNCLACHTIADGVSPGNIGPTLEQMKKRFPNKADLYSQIYDARQKNPKTVMPPFGRNGVLTEQEINFIVDYLYTL